MKRTEIWTLNTFLVILDTNGIITPSQNMTLLS